MATLSVLKPAIFGRLIFFGVWLVLILGSGWVGAQTVVINEIHYHPVEEAAFRSDGSPALDLYEDVHEFVELHNASSTLTISLGGWRLKGGIGFSFPPQFQIPPGGYCVVAKNPARIQEVYPVPGAVVLGPYEGQLSNQGERIELEDVKGRQVDAVSYSAAFPWPLGADALGADSEWTGLDVAKFQYKGRSLERVSPQANSSDPANWLASRLAFGPTPGRKNSTTRPVPLPVVVLLEIGKEGSGAFPIGPNEAARVRCFFSSSKGLTQVRLEWVVDDINRTNEMANFVAMTHEEDRGTYSALIPPQPARTVLRYRIRANRGTGEEVVSPRLEDPGPWHGYFVTPVRAGTRPSYDAFVSTASLNILNANISQNPRRVTQASDAGQPRDSWNATEPGIFASEGKVYDIQIRYHGSRYNRSAVRGSYKLKFPRYAPFNEHDSTFITDKLSDLLAGFTLFSEAGLPSCELGYVDWYLNNNGGIQRLEQEEYGGDLLDRFARKRERQFPQDPVPKKGEILKCVGNDGDPEGPFGKGDGRLLVPLPPHWTALQRYEHTYALQNHSWLGGLDTQRMFEGLWAARGDTPGPSIGTLGVPTVTTNIPAVRAYLEKTFDVDATLTYLAVLSWMSPWDDVVHNHCYWRQRNGLWGMLPWDLDALMGGNIVFSNPAYSIYDGEALDPSTFHFGNVGPQYMKDSFYKAFREEYRRKLFLLNNTLLHPENISALGLENVRGFADQRHPFVNAQCLQGDFHRPERPVALSPSSGSSIYPEVLLRLAPYTHSNPTAVPQLGTRWQVRLSEGSWDQPLVNLFITNSPQTLVVTRNLLKVGASYSWRAITVDSNHHPSLASQEHTFIYTYPEDSSPLILNEVLARNEASVEEEGRYPDYVEIHNPSSSAISLKGYSLTKRHSVPQDFQFPDTASIAAGGYLVVWCSEESVGDQLITGFTLSGAGDRLLLLNQQGSVSLMTDQIAFGPQAMDVSIGRGPSGWSAVYPSPGVANTVHPTAPPTKVKINEWMAQPEQGAEWIEIFNPGQLLVDLTGVQLADDPSLSNVWVFPPLSFMGARGVTRVDLEGSVPLKLNGSAGRLVLTGENGVIDGIYYGPQTFGVSQGRLPDGGSSIVSFPESTSPGESNWIPFAGVEIHEVLANAANPYEPAIEFYNRSSSSIDLAGHYLSTNLRNPRQWRVPLGFNVPAKGYAVLHSADFSASGLVIEPLSRSDLYLFGAGPAGELTGLRHHRVLQAAPPNISWGTHLTSLGSQQVPLALPTFGKAPPSSLAEFRTGRGASNSLPVIGPIIMTELVYERLLGSGTNRMEDPGLEFVELSNVSGFDLDLKGWSVRDGIDFRFEQTVLLTAGKSLLVVRFDPLKTSELSNFKTHYGIGSDVGIVGPFSGRLNNGGERVELWAPLPQSEKGFLTEWIEYSDELPWSVIRGTELSLTRVSGQGFANDPVHWQGELPSPGRFNSTDNHESDRDGDGMPDSWETRYRLDPDSQSDADNDEDLDGASNLDEYRAGTNPLDATSRLRIVSITRSADQVTLVFSAVEGKSYVLESSGSLGLPFSVIFSLKATTTGLITVTAPETRSIGFWRVRL